MPRCNKISGTRKDGTKVQCRREAAPGYSRCQKCLDNRNKARDRRRSTKKATCSKCYKPVCHPQSTVCEDHRFPGADENDHRHSKAIFFNSYLLIQNHSIGDDSYYWRPWERDFIRGLEV